MIISDEGMSTETGEGTDFVILMSGEPQCAIKMRRHDPDLYGRYDRQYDRSYGLAGLCAFILWWQLIYPVVVAPDVNAQDSSPAC